MSAHDDGPRYFDPQVELEVADVELPGALVCDHCADPFDTASGCCHFGRQLCAADLVHCGSCAAEFADDRGVR